MKYLAAVDLSDASLLTLDALKALAGDEPGDVTLLHVVDLDLYTAGGSVPAIMDFARERLAQESERLAGCGLSTPTIRVEQGDATQTILRVAAEENADLVVMTNLGKGARTGRLFGSTAERVASSGTIPVLIEQVMVDEGDGGSCCRVVAGSSFERVLVAVDLEDDTSAMLTTVAEYPAVQAFRVVHVTQSDEDVARAEARLAELLRDMPMSARWEHVVLVGRPAEALMAEATSWGATAIALSPCSHGALHRAVWGSVARSVAQNAQLPVLFVPHSLTR